MYSLVLMMALSGGVEAPAGHHDCGGCYGCCGGYSCGGGCYGCCGGSCHGGHGHHGCHGGHSMFGHHHHDSCCGCCGGYSSCCGSSCCGGYYGCCGGYSGCCGGYYGCNGGYCGGWSAYTGCNGCYGGMAAPTAPVTPPAPTPPPDSGKPMTPDDMPKPKPKTGGGTDGANIPAPATILVSLPADAKLMIDDTTTKSTSAARVFVSPELAPGQQFHYTLKAEIVRDGQTLTVTEQVAVRAGAETRVSFGAEKFVSGAVAQK
jgi:uncharacterized protein (TIGR03000 family)